MYLIKYLPTYLPMWLYLIWDLVKTLQRNDLYRTIIFLFTPPSTSFAERLQSHLSSPCRKVLVKKNLFISKSWHITCPWHRELVSSTNFLIEVYVISNKQSIFPVRSAAVVCNKFAITDKPLHKHDSNKYQSKAFFICNQRSFQTRFVTYRVRKQNILGLSDVLITINQQYQHRTNQKLRSWANTVFQNCGVFEANVSFSSPTHHFSFLLLSQLSRRTHAKRLLCRL